MTLLANAARELAATIACCVVACTLALIAAVTVVLGGSILWIVGRPILQWILQQLGAVA